MIKKIELDSDSEENEFECDLVNMYEEDLGFNMESDTEVNVS